MKCEQILTVGNGYYSAPDPTLANNAPFGGHYPPCSCQDCAQNPAPCRFNSSDDEQVFFLFFSLVCKLILKKSETISTVSGRSFGVSGSGLSTLKLREEAFHHVSTRQE